MIGNPNITIGTSTFNAIAEDGVYVLSTSVWPYRDMLTIARQGNKDGSQRIKVERLVDLAPNGTTDPTLKTLRVYHVYDVPKHSAVTANLINALEDQIATLQTATNIGAELRGEV